MLAVLIANTAAWPCRHLDIVVVVVVVVAIIPFIQRTNQKGFQGGCSLVGASVCNWLSVCLLWKMQISSSC